MKRDIVLRQAENWINIVKKAAAVLLTAGICCLNSGNMQVLCAADEMWNAENMQEVCAVDEIWNAGNMQEVCAADEIWDAEVMQEVCAADEAWEAENITLAAVSDRERLFDGWVQDDAGLLTAEEEEALETECGHLFQAHDTGVYIITTPDFGGGDIKDWQRQIFSQYDLGADSDGSGVMLAISMAERDWGLVGFGAAQEAFSTYARERLGSLILDDLSDGKFYEAFSGYLSIADDYLSAAEEEKPYTEQHRYREGWRFPVIFGVSFLLSLGISAAVVVSWKKGMNTRVRQKGAMEYLKAGSFYLSNQSDLFLYHTVSRTPRPKSDSSDGGGSMHSDSSGTSGKF